MTDTREIAEKIAKKQITNVVNLDTKRKQLADAIDEALRNEREATWQPIETAPKERQVLVVNQTGDVEQAWWSSVVGRWCSALGGICEPTLWQPLPNPPAQIKGE